MTTTTASFTQIKTFGSINCYLVREEDGFTLIDAGVAGSAKAVLKAVESAGVPLRRIVLTHAHSDHVGAIDKLATVSGLELICSARSAQFMRGEKRLLPTEPEAKIRGSYPAVAMKPTQIVSHDDMVGSLRVIAAPGHSPDHIALIDERDGTLYAGDAFQTLGGLAVSGDLRWRFPLPAWATWHKGMAIDSAENLLALKPNRLAVGHGEPLEQPQAALADVIERAKATLYRGA